MATALKRDRSPLPVRAQRVVDEAREQEKQVRERFTLVLKAISSSSSLDHAKRLAAVASDGLVPGTLQWSFTTRIVLNPKIKGFCPSCGCDGDKCSTELWADSCPMELGVREYEGCSARA